MKKIIYFVCFILVFYLILEPLGKKVIFYPEIPNDYSDLIVEIEKVIDLGTRDYLDQSAFNEFGDCGYRNINGYGFVDINNDGQKDLIVDMFMSQMCGGSGSGGQYLLVALNENDSFELKGIKQVGYRGDYLDTEQVHKNDNFLIFRNFSYHWDGRDPMCCPSKEGISRIALSNLLNDSYYDQIEYSKPLALLGNSFSIDLNDLKNERIFYEELATDVDWLLNKLAWQYKDQVLHPSCFKTEWISSDNIEEYNQRFIDSEVDWEYFSQNLGKFWGKEINIYDPIQASWGEEIELAVSMENCLKKKTNYFWLGNDGQIGSSMDKDLYEYRILSKVPLEDCQNLAPHLPGKCIQSNLMRIVEHGGGSLSWGSYVIYGLFLMPEGKEYIFPLKTFESEDDKYIKSLFKLNQ
tara:strand:- start:47 stop:1270 length:1224 start_codon:yes stop_codon:yes gene_type:complete